MRRATIFVAPGKIKAAYQVLARRITPANLCACGERHDAIFGFISRNVNKALVIGRHVKRDRRWRGEETKRYEMPPMTLGEC